MATATDTGTRTHIPTPRMARQEKQELFQARTKKGRRKKRNKRRKRKKKKIQSTRKGCDDAALAFVSGTQGPNEGK